MPQQNNSYPVPTKQFGLTDIIKLIGLLCFFLALGVASKDVRCFFLFTAAISIFLTEHFASSRRMEWLFLIGLPATGWMLAACVFSLSLLHLGPMPNMWADLGTFVALILLTGVLSVVGSALSVVAVCFLCARFHRFTGIRLLKFNWTDAPDPNPTSDREPAPDPDHNSEERAQ